MGYMMSDARVPHVQSLNKIGMFNEDDIRRINIHLPDLAQLFIDHEKHEYYGIGYLHKHSDIPENSVWVHEREGEIDNVVAKDRNSIDPSEMQAHSFCMEDNQIKVVEFEEVKTATPREPLGCDFLCAIKILLKESELQDIVSICPREKEVMFETLLDNDRGTTAAPISIKPIGEGIFTETAQWCFDAPQSLATASPGQHVDPMINSQRECWVNRDGFHFVNGDSEVVLPAKGPIIKAQRECWVNRDGFHFVNGDAEMVSHLAGQPLIKSQREC